MATVRGPRAHVDAARSSSTYTKTEFVEKHGGAREWRSSLAPQVGVSFVMRR